MKNFRYGAFFKKKPSRGDIIESFYKDVVVVEVLSWGKDYEYFTTEDKSYYCDMIVRNATHGDIKK